MIVLIPGFVAMVAWYANKWIDDFVLFMVNGE